MKYPVYNYSIVQAKHILQKPGQADCFLNVKHNSSHPVFSEDARVYDEQLRLLFDALPLAVIVSLINSIILGYVQWDVVKHSSLFAWFGLVIFVTAARLLLVFFYKRKGNGLNQGSFWEKRFNLGAIGAGSTWGLAAFLLFPEASLANQVFLAFVVAGMSAGAVTSLSFMLFPIRVFLFLSLVPLMFRFLLEGSGIALAMSVMVALFFISVWVSSKRIYENTLQNISLKHSAHEREKALKESEARYRLIFESAPVGIVHFDRNGKIVSSNTMFAQLMGMEFSQMENVDLLKVATEPSVQDAIKAALEGSSAHFTVTSNAVMGNRDVPVRGYVCSLLAEEEGVVGGVGIFEDITEDRRVEKMKDEFISTVSHELRTPLTSIKGSLGLLEGTMREHLPDDMVSLLDIANRNAERLLLLINDILDISKIEAHKMKFNIEPIEVMEFIKHILQENEAYGHQYVVGFRLVHEENDLVFPGDRHRLMQVFSNLLSNAAKFSTKGSMVDLGVYREDEFVRFEVTDRGAGIPTDFHGHIFEKFAQYDSSDTRNAGGTGLGLSISKAIVEQHNGSIEFDSEVNRGTTFYVRLPLH
jgi:PAS domain S-box-containing protein